MASQEKKEKSKDELINDLEGLVDILSSDMITAMDIKNEKKKLLMRIRDLRREEIELNDMVIHLKSARGKLESELDKKEREEEDLKLKLVELKEGKATMETEKFSLEQQVRQLKQEKDDLNESLERTNDILIKLKHHIEQFDETIKS